MSKILTEQLNNFKNYNYDENSKNIINKNNHSGDVNEFLEIIHLLDTRFIEYDILNNFNISILK